MIKGEKKLILELQNKNENAFNIIYKEYYKLIYYVIYQMVDDEEVARDLTADTFVTMYQKIDQHDINKSFKYWLVTIAKNNARHYFREKKRENLIVDDEIIARCKDEIGDAKNLLAMCKNLLTQKEYDVLNYKIVFNMTFVEIGLLCNVSKSEAHRIYKRAIGKLKMEL